jgi:hypothetical protein
MAVFMLTKHVKERNTRLIEIQVLDKEGGEVLGVESFAWGFDIPLARVRAETLALLNEKYNPVSETLPGTGQPL